MRILGIDHSTACTGWGLIRAELIDGQLDYEYIAHGYLEKPKGLNYPDTLRYMGNSVRDLLAELKPDMVALEAPKDNRGFKATQALTELVGIIKYILMTAGYPFKEIPPSTMKKLVTGYGWSTKEEVATKIAELFSIPYENLVKVETYKTGEKKGRVRSYKLDGTDALGLALAFIPYVKSQGGRLDFEYQRGTKIAGTTGAS